MTASSAPWWFLAIIFALAVAMIVAPSRIEVLEWRRQRRVQGRLEQAELVAGHLTVKLTRDGVFVGDVALAVAQALDELGVERTARPSPRARLPKMVIVDSPGGVSESVSRGIRDAVSRIDERATRTLHRPKHGGSQ